jgi:hypothetical protein
VLILALNLYLSHKKLRYSLYLAPGVLLFGVASLLPIPVKGSPLVDHQAVFQLMGAEYAMMSLLIFAT